MRTRSKLLTATAVALIAASTSVSLAATTHKKDVPQICKDIPDSEKPTVAVADFLVKVDVSPDVGHGMATMLANALQNTGCFQVVERERLGDVLAEQSLGQSGAVEDETAPAVGKLAGAQFQFMGAITSFSEGASGAKIGALFTKMFGSKGPRAVLGDVDMKVAEVNFSIRVVNSANGKMVDSGEWKTKRKSVGFAASEASGWWGPGLQSIGAAGFKTQAMADAISDGIISASTTLADASRAKMLAQLRSTQGAIAQVATIDRNSCSALSLPRPPRIMVIIPEEHILGQPGAYVANDAYVFEKHVDQGTAGQASTLETGATNLALRFIRPPDPAGETEIIKRLTEFGFTVVDGSVYAELRRDEQFRRAGSDPTVAASLGARYDADIVITGEAFSEFSKNLSNMMSCRARVEAKAVDVHTGHIIAADGLHGGGLDNSEIIAGKTALRNAGAKVAEYFITRICSSGVSGSEASAARAPVPSPTAIAKGSTGVTVVHLVVKNISFSKASELQKALEKNKHVSGVSKESFQDGEARLAIRTTGDAEAIADLIQDGVTGGPVGMEVTSLQKDTILVKLR